MSNNTVAEKKEIYTPMVNIHETTSETILTIDLPGVDEKGVEVSFEKDILTIKADPSLTIPDGYKILHKEFLMGQYLRKFNINKPVDIEKVTAVMKNGRLKLKLPFTVPNSKKIEVKTES